MARPMWSGAISFGLVTVPVKLYSAPSSHRVDCHRFQEGPVQRIGYKRVAEGTDEEVDYDIVKGHKVEKGGTSSSPRKSWRRSSRAADT